MCKQEGERWWGEKQRVREQHGAGEGEVNWRERATRSVAWEKEAHQGDSWKILLKIKEKSRSLKVNSGRTRVNWEWYRGETDTR